MNWSKIPSLSALRAFDATVRQGSFSAAARELNVTHAAIAQHVRLLETHFAVALIRREGKGMVPTEEGVALAKGLSDGFDCISMAVYDLLDRGQNRPLRVALTPVFASTWLMPRLGHFWQAYPEIDLELLPGHGLVDLRRDSIDVALRFGGGDWQGYDIKQLVDAPIVAVCSLQMDLDPVDSLSALQDQKWLLDATWTEQSQLALQRDLNLELARKATFATCDLQRVATLNSLGVGFFPLPIVEQDIQLGQLKLLYTDVGTDSSYHVLTRPDVVNPRRDIFVKWLFEMAKASS